MDENKLKMDENKGFFLSIILANSTKIAKFGHQNSNILIFTQFAHNTHNAHILERPFYSLQAETWQKFGRMLTETKQTRMFACSSAKRRSRCMYSIALLVDTQLLHREPVPYGARMTNQVRLQIQSLQTSASSSQRITTILIRPS